MPWQPAVLVLAEQARDQPRTPGQAGAAGDFAVTRDLASRDRSDRVEDTFARILG
jgi:hypothetical protein